MKNILLTTIIFAASATLASAQETFTPLPQGNHAFALGPRFSAEAFRPALAPEFTANDKGVTAADETAVTGGIVRHAPLKSAAVHYSYTASGTDRETQAKATWNMQAGTLSDGRTALQNVIPDGFESGGLAAPYTIVNNTIVIKPTYMGSTDSYHVFLFAYDNSQSNYDVRINLDGNGAMSVAPDLNIVYGAFTTKTFDPDAYEGYYESYSAVSYKKDVKVGDANEDNVVDKGDTQTLVNHVLNRTQENSDADAMDTNGDGNINVADVIGLHNILRNSK